MGRFSPSYYAPLDERDYGGELADAIGSYAAAKRQEKLDQRAEEEYEYTKRRRGTLDSLEEALLRAQLYERGVVPTEDGESGASQLPGEGQPRITPGRSGVGGQGPGRGVLAPGSFNPATGTFNFVLPQSPDLLDRGGGRASDLLDRGPSTRRASDLLDRAGAPDLADLLARQGRNRQGRIRLGAGFDLDPSLTERGRADATKRRMIEAMVARGVPREEAELEVLGGLEGAIGEHLHPGPFHPRTMEEALNYEKDLIRTRGDQEVRAARARATRDKDRDPRWEERRKSWVRELGEPTDEMEQDILDALSSGYSTDEILEAMPESRKSRAQRYLRRAIRRGRREAEQPE